MSGGEPAAGLRELFDAELVPVLRRLGERAQGSGELRLAESAKARAAVWGALASLGCLAPGSLRGAVAVAEVIGEALFQSPLLDAWTALDALSGERHRDLRDRIAAGELTVAVAARRDGRADPRRPGPVRHADGQLSGDSAFVAFAADVDALLVVAPFTGATSPGPDADLGSGLDPAPALALVPTDQPGVHVSRMDDIGRGDFHRVRLDRARVWPDTVEHDAGWDGLLDRARLRHAAYLIGICRGALAVAVERAKDREVFGRPLATFQAPAFQLAALAASVEAVRTLVYRAGDAADEGQDVAVPAAQGLAQAATLATRTTAEAVHLHGALGMTEECDAQVYYRRAVVDGLLLGTPAQLRAEAARALTADHRGSVVKAPTECRAPMMRGLS